MVRKIYILLIALFTQYFSAQETINKKDSINGNVYSIEMDIRINDLLEQTENKCRQYKINSKISDKRKIPVNKLLDRNKKMHKSHSIMLSIAEICKKKPKLMGYKIQVALTNNENDVNRIRYEVRKNFPNLRTELDGSLMPNYKIMAGSYFTKESGKIDLKKVRNIYHEAILIPYRIFCVESK
nr:SPOR domain-containing protein [Elizabethkingia sp. ASV34]